MTVPATGLAVLSLGSNLGDRAAHLRTGLAVLGPVAVSSLWRTAPVGGVEQDDFLNLVALVAADATTVWDRAQRAEAVAGRAREVRWGPRTLDVDVVWAPPPVPPGLVVPHPRAAGRAFVLAPWHELDAAAVLPGAGRVAGLLALVADQEVTRVGPLPGAPA